ncbi:hypothetical protein [Methanolobus bombayensis]|uniref:hypothetical protein n=1 Tax=Methanolobus bombayensis TaxID=38023 RepID=UPI001AEA5B63|nr:hypothetical protein [Methanolobus bombayensis]MBP1907973.1 hypothetical protein [Methanolobus bombayensis]
MLSSGALTPEDHPIGFSAVLPGFPRDRLYRTIQCSVLRLSIQSQIGSAMLSCKDLTIRMIIYYRSGI